MRTTRSGQPYPLFESKEVPIIGKQRTDPCRDSLLWSLGNVSLRRSRPIIGCASLFTPKSANEFLRVVSRCPSLLFSPPRADAMPLGGQVFQWNHTPTEGLPCFSCVSTQASCRQVRHPEVTVAVQSAREEDRTRMGQVKMLAPFTTQVRNWRCCNRSGMKLRRCRALH